jgi:hypothetical protein
MLAQSHASPAPLTMSTSGELDSIAMRIEREQVNARQVHASRVFLPQRRYPGLVDTPRGLKRLV